MTSIVSGTLRPLTIDDLKNILGRSVVDSSFLEHLKGDSDLVLTGLGIQPSDGSRKFFRALSGATFGDACKLVRTDGVPRPPNIVFFD